MQTGIVPRLAVFGPLLENSFEITDLSGVQTPQNAVEKKLKALLTYRYRSLLQGRAPNLRHLQLIWRLYLQIALMTWRSVFFVPTLVE